MNLQQFTESVAGGRQPAGLPVFLQSLWHDGAGNWERAHELVQDEPGTMAAHIHAYLHRKEGDNWNADYWYRRAGQPRPPVSLDAEWAQLVEACLNMDRVNR